MNIQTTKPNGDVLLRFIKATFTTGFLPLFVLMFSLQNGHAGSATWSAVDQGVFEYWTDVNNWTPETVPNGPNDIATFPSTSSLDTLPEINSPVELDSLIFDRDCPGILIEVDGTLTMSGRGIINNSGSNKVIFVKPYPAGELDFTNSAVAGGDDCYITGYERPIRFFDTSSAGSGRLTADSGPSDGRDCVIEFNDNSSGGTATLFAGGEGGGVIRFRDEADGSGADVELFGNGKLDVGAHVSPGVVLGSLAGRGYVLLGATDRPTTGGNLRVGANGANTVFSGVIQDAGKNGSLTKIGDGRLILAKANTYGGGTTVESGVLLANNAIGSGTGTGNVFVTGGTFGGSGTVAGRVSVGTGNGSGAFLAPGINGVKPGTLTIQKRLILEADATYKVTFDSRTLFADMVTSLGASVRNASIAFNDLGANVIPIGRVFILINNTASTLITGTFTNLADGSAVTVGNNKFQANYEGGDGNDLTLTVVP
jgi:autotransporter-associated beta strand protein